MKKDNFLKGTLITYFAILFIKILGALYVIPFYKIIGEEGGILYNYAYQIYNLFFTISTAGIPVALSILLSEFNSLKEYKNEAKTYKLANKLVMFLSIISFLVLFIFAGNIGNFFTSGIEGATDLKNIKIVIRSISFCLLVVPFLSIIRGYLQAHKYPSVSAYSQVIEQLVRIFILLANSYLFIKVLGYDVVYGVSASLFGALFGGAIAYIYLYFKKKKIVNESKDNKKGIEKSNKEIINKIILYSVPMILISIMSDLYNIIDIKLIIIGLTNIGYDASKSEIIASILSTWAPKICVIIMAISTSMASSIIPHIVESYVKEDNESVNKKIKQALEIILLVTIPLFIGITFLSTPTYYLFYGESLYGPKILIIVALINIICSIYTVLNTILQCMKLFKNIYINIFIGLFVNMTLDIPMIYLLNSMNISPYIGTAVASVLGFTVSCILSVNTLKNKVGFKISSIKNYVLKLLVPTIGLICILFILKLLIPIKIEYGSIKIILLFMVYILLSAIVYFFLLFKMKILDEIEDIKIIDKIKRKFERK